MRIRLILLNIRSPSPASRMLKCTNGCSVFILFPRALPYKNDGCSGFLNKRRKNGAREEKSSMIGKAPRSGNSNRECMHMYYARHRCTAGKLNYSVDNAKNINGTRSLSFEFEISLSTNPCR